MIIYICRQPGSVHQLCCRAVTDSEPPPPTRSRVKLGRSRSTGGMEKPRRRGTRILLRSREPLNASAGCQVRHSAPCFRLSVTLPHSTDCGLLSPAARQSARRRVRLPHLLRACTAVCHPRVTHVPPPFPHPHPLFSFFLLRTASALATLCSGKGPQAFFFFLFVFFLLALGNELLCSTRATSDFLVFWSFTRPRFSSRMQPTSPVHSV